MLLETIESDLKKAMLAKDEDKKSALRMVKGEIPRLNLKAGEKPTDEDIQKIITKLIKSELLVLEYSGQDKDNSAFVNILSQYLPQMMNKAQVQSWIVDNIDLSQFPSKIKAMGAIMKHLKGKADGNLVKDILLEM
jgi:uncharacterized protein YqeY